MKKNRAVKPIVSRIFQGLFLYRLYRFMLLSL